MCESTEECGSSGTGTYRRCTGEGCGRYRCGYCGDEKCRIYIKFTIATKYIMDMKYTKYVKICYNGFRFKKIKMER